MSTIRMVTRYGWYAEMDSADLPWDGHEIARIMAAKVVEEEIEVMKNMERIQNAYSNSCNMAAAAGMMPQQGYPHYRRYENYFSSQASLGGVIGCRCPYCGR